jgi:hypothetical protein
MRYSGIQIRRLQLPHFSLCEARRVALIEHRKPLAVNGHAWPFTLATQALAMLGYHDVRAHLDLSETSYRRGQTEGARKDTLSLTVDGEV